MCAIFGIYRRYLGIVEDEKMEEASVDENMLTTDVRKLVMITNSKDRTANV